MAKSMCFDLRTVYVKKKSVPLQNYNVQSVTSIQHSTIYKLKVRRLSNVPWRILDRQPISGSPEFIVVRNLSLVWVEEARLVHQIFHHYSSCHVVVDDHIHICQVEIFYKLVGFGYGLCMVVVHSLLVGRDHSPLVVEGDGVRGRTREVEEVCDHNLVSICHSRGLLDNSGNLCILFWGSLWPSDPSCGRQSTRLSQSLRALCFLPSGPEYVCR